MPASKSQQMKTLRAERDSIGQEIGSLRERLAVLERRSVEINAKIAHLEAGGRTRIGNPRRSIARVAWKDFERLTWQRNGITTDDIFESLRAKVPRLRKATLRVYLHRFRKKRLIERRGSLWHRSPEEAPNQT